VAIPHHILYSEVFNNDSLIFAYRVEHPLIDVELAGG
jgi:hypothetical protein